MRFLLRVYQSTKNGFHSINIKPEETFSLISAFLLLMLQNDRSVLGVRM